MGFFAELFRLEEWKRLPTRHARPLVAFLVTSLVTTAVLIVIGWPANPWRILVAAVVGVTAASLTRWIIVHKISTPDSNANVR